MKPKGEATNLEEALYRVSIKEYLRASNSKGNSGAKATLTSRYYRTYFSIPLDQVLEILLTFQEINRSRLTSNLNKHKGISTYFAISIQLRVTPTKTLQLIEGAPNE